MNRRRWDGLHPVTIMCVVITAAIAVVVGELAYTNHRYGQHPTVITTVTVETTVIGSK